MKSQAIGIGEPDRRHGEPRLLQGNRARGLTAIRFRATALDHDEVWLGDGLGGIGGMHGQETV